MIINLMMMSIILKQKLSFNSANKLAPKKYIIKASSKQGRVVTIDKAVEIFYSQLNNAESI